MTLIKSISGIRGTIGGAPGENLTPLDLVKFTSAYGRWSVSYTHLLRALPLGCFHSATAVCRTGFRYPRAEDATVR